MSDYFVVIGAFICAFIISFAVTPLARRLAIKVGALDVPKTERKIHKGAMPYFGGLAIYVAIISCLFVFLPHTKQNLAIMAGATVIVIVGIIDDMYDMPAKIKLLAQIVAACIAVYGGIRINFITNPFSESGYVFFAMFSIPATIIWIVGVTNTINLIDGLDGLAAGVSGIAALTFFVTAITKNYDFIYIYCVVVAGAAFGFLPHNFNPAKIFMGDTGAMLLGYMLAVIAAIGAVKSVAAIALIIPVFTIGVPIIDTFFAIVRRVSNNRSIMEADKEHLHHQLLKRGLSHRQTVLVLYTISIILGGTAVYISNVDAITGITTVVLMFCVIILLAERVGLIRFFKQKNKEE